MKVMVQFTLLESQVCKAWFSKRDWDWTGCGDRSIAEWSAEVESPYTMIWEMYGSIIAHQMPVEMADSSALKTMALHIKVGFKYIGVRLQVCLPHHFLQDNNCID